MSLSENQHTLVKIVCLQLITSSPSMLSKASHLVDADLSWGVEVRGGFTLHEKSPLSRVKCVVKGLLKATFARFWRSLTRIKDHLWIHLCSLVKGGIGRFYPPLIRLRMRVKGDPLIRLCLLSKAGQKCNQICLRFKSKVCLRRGQRCLWRRPKVFQRCSSRSALARLARASRSRSSFALRVRLSRFARSTS